MASVPVKKDFDLAMQTMRIDGQWTVQGNFWVSTQRAADALIAILEVTKTVLAENEPSYAGDE